VLCSENRSDISRGNFKDRYARILLRSMSRFVSRHQSCLRICPATLVTVASSFAPSIVCKNFIAGRFRKKGSKAAEEAADDRSASVYRKEGKGGSVVETNPEIDLAEGRALAGLYLERRVKTYDFVGETPFSTPSHQSRLCGESSRRENPKRGGGSLFKACRLPAAWTEAAIWLDRKSETGKNHLDALLTVSWRGS